MLSGQNSEEREWQFRERFHASMSYDELGEISIVTAWPSLERGCGDFTKNGSQFSLWLGVSKPIRIRSGGVGGRRRTEKTTALSRLKTGACRVDMLEALEIASGVWATKCGSFFMLFMASEREEFQQLKDRRCRR